jgi:hypothetical protein
VKEELSWESVTLYGADVRGGHSQLSMAREVTVHRYFKKWADSGLFQRLWHTVLVFLNQKGRLKNDVHVVDGSLVMVQHLSKKIAFISTKLRPKRAIKFSILVDAQGIPLATSSVPPMIMIPIFLSRQSIR